MAGASSYALKAYEQAYYYLSPYVSEHPGDIAARKLLAATQLRLGRTADAANTLDPVKNEASDDTELLQMIGEAAARGGDVPTARRYLNLALKYEPDNGMLRTQLGIAEIAAGDAGAAIRNLERVVAIYPAASLPEIPLFVAFMQTKDYGRALATAEQLKKAEPSEPIGEILTAAVQLNQGKLQEGREALLRARAIRHGDISSNDTLAKLALAAGRPDEARRYFQDILDANPESAETYIALAELEAKTGRAAAAEAVLLKGVQTVASNPAIAITLARLQLSIGEARQALDSATEALKKFPRNLALLDIAGTAQLELGQSDEALSTFKDLIDVAPDLASGHTGLAKVYLAQFTPDNPQWPAVNEATEAVSLAPQDTAAKLVLARALAVHGRVAQASELLQELRHLKPQDAELLEIEAIVARGQGRSGRSRRGLRTRRSRQRGRRAAAPGRIAAAPRGYRAGREESDGLARRASRRQRNPQGPGRDLRQHRPARRGARALSAACRAGTEKSGLSEQSRMGVDAAGKLAGGVAARSRGRGAAAGVGRIPRYAGRDPAADRKLRGGAGRAGISLEQGRGSA